MFTLAFPGDLRKFKGNPFKTETPFGVPVSGAIGDAIEQRGSLLDEREELLEALREAHRWFDKAVPDSPAAANYLNGDGREDRRDGWDDGVSIFERIELLIAKAEGR